MKSKSTIQNKKASFSRLLQMVLPMVILFGIIMGSSLITKAPLGPDTASTYVRATVTDIPEDYSAGTPFTGNQRVLATITSGEFKGQTCQLNNSNSYHMGAFCVPGIKIIALIRCDDSGAIGGTVYNYDRTEIVYLLLGLFALTLILVGGKKGLVSLYALFFTFVCVLCVYVPLLYVGVNGILAAIVTAILILTASIYILNGWSSKTLCAMIGTTAGVAISGILAMLIGSAANLSGYNVDEIESLLFIDASTELDIANILYAGVLISSLGAVMDVSVSMVAAMQEIRNKAPKLSARELFASGMRVGHDMMGTMSNTLILAYTGSATSVLLAVYSYGMPFLQIMGYNSIVTEILCGLCGTIGVILTVPLQAAISTVALKHKI